MTCQSNVRTVRDAFAAWAAGTGSFYDLLDEDAVIRIPGTARHCGRWNSRLQFIAEMVQPFLTSFEYFRLDVRDIWADDDRVVVHWTSTAVERGGRPYENEYIYIIKMAGDRAVEVTAFLDMVAFNAVWDRQVDDLNPDLGSSASAAGEDA